MDDPDSEPTGDVEWLRECFARDLSALGDLRNRLPRQLRPSIRTLATAAQVSHGSVENWLAGRVVPENAEPLLRAVELLRSAAERAATPRPSGVDAPTPRPSGRDSRTSRPSRTDSLLDAEGWRRRHRAVKEAEQRRARIEQSGKRALASLTAADVRSRRAALAAPSRPVREWGAAALGVHPAVPGRRADGRGGPGFVLPAFVPRAHDAELTGAVAGAAASSRSVLLVVRGGSCSGKTRSLTEAVTRCAEMAEWTLHRPRTVGDTLELLAPDMLPPRSVLWLDDLHEVLRGADGETLAAALSSRLDRPGPLLVAGTIWSGEHDTLTRLPDAGAADPHGRARRLLDAAFRTVVVPPAFDGAALEALERAAIGDSSLREAVERSRDSMITQTLAAGVQLVEAWDAAGKAQPPLRYAWAVVTAAMDAGRLGWAGPLPEAFLRDAAPGYLTDDERAAAPADWFEAALAAARRKVLRTAAALEPVALPTGMGARPGLLRLNDYLDAHARDVRRCSPPHHFWNAAAHHATRREDLGVLADRAADRRRMRAAERLYVLSARAGSPFAFRRAHGMLTRAGRHAEAADLVRTALDGGPAEVDAEAVDVLWESGDVPGAEDYAHRAAGRGRPRALAALAVRYDKHRDDEAAERFARLAADLGDPSACTYLAEGRAILDGSRNHLYRYAAERGDPAGHVGVGHLLTWAGDQEEAEEHYRLAAEQDHPQGLAALARRRIDAGDLRGAEALLLREVVHEDDRLHVELALAYERAGDPAGAERVAFFTARRREPAAVVELVLHRERAGDRAGAVRLALCEETRGSRGAAAALVRHRAEGNDLAGAERVALLAAEQGDPWVLDALALNVDDPREAERFALLAAGHGCPRALVVLGQRVMGVDAGTAERLFLLAADHGDLEGYDWAGWLHQNRREFAEARRLFRAAADRGHQDSCETLARLLENDGERREAEHYARRAQRAYLGIVLNHLNRNRLQDAAHFARLAAEQGDLHPYVVLRQKARETGGPEAEEAVAHETRLTTQRFEQLYRDAVDRGEVLKAAQFLWMLEKVDAPTADRLTTHCADESHPYDWLTP